MYLFVQLASYLFVAFLLGVAVGYGLWRLWGERDALARYKTAERKLAEYIAQWEAEHRPGQGRARG